MSDTFGHDQPQWHTIKDGSFECAAPEDAPCRTYPTCECESWIDEYEEYRQHACTDTSKPGQPCWIEPWIDTQGLEDSYDGDPVTDDDGEYAWPDGAVITSWEGDYVLWSYATEATT